MNFLFDHDVPDSLSYLLEQLGHHVSRLRTVLPDHSPDEVVFDFAFRHGFVLITCNRDDFLSLAASKPHNGVIIVIRRRTRSEERAALLRLLELAGETGIHGNINFA